MTLTAKRSIWMVVGVILVVGAIAGWKIITVRAIIAKMSAPRSARTDALNRR